MVWRTCREELLLLLAVVCGWAFRGDVRVGVVVAEEHDLEFGDAERRGEDRLGSRGDGGSGCMGVGRGVSPWAREGAGMCLGSSEACKRARLSE